MEPWWFRNARSAINIGAPRYSKSRFFSPNWFIFHHGVNRKPFTGGGILFLKVMKFVSHIGIGSLVSQKWQMCYKFKPISSFQLIFLENQSTEYFNQNLNWWCLAFQMTLRLCNLWFFLLDWTRASPKKSFWYCYFQTQCFKPTGFKSGNVTAENFSENVFHRKSFLWSVGSILFMPPWWNYRSATAPLFQTISENEILVVFK